MENVSNYIERTRIGINRAGFDWTNSQNIPNSSAPDDLIKKMLGNRPQIFNINEKLRISHEQAGILPREIDIIKKSVPRQTIADAIAQGLLSRVVSVPELKPNGSIVRDANGNIVYTQKLFKDILYSSKNDLKQFYRYLISETPTIQDLAKKMILDQLIKQGGFTNAEATTVVNGMEVKVDEEDIDDVEEEEKEKISKKVERAGYWLLNKARTLMNTDEETQERGRTLYPNSVAFSKPSVVTQTKNEPKSKGVTAPKTTPSYNKLKRRIFGLPKPKKVEVSDWSVVPAG